MWGGFFAVIPLVTVHFVDGLGWTAASIGLVLGLRQLTQQGLTVFGGAWSDRTGPKPLILAGCVLRTLGFAGMAVSTTFPSLLAAALLAGVGGGLFDAPKNSAITSVTRPEQRSRMFSLTGIAGNLGMVMGPLIGAALLPLGFRTAGLTAAATYLVALAVLAVTLPHVRPERVAGSGLAGLKTAALDARFRRFTLVLIGYFILSTQINVAVTLKAISLAGLGATAPSQLYAVAGTGFLGGYSTFSTACLEAARLLLDGRGGAALMHALAMTAGTLLAAVVGMAVGMEVGMALGSTPA